MKLLNWLADHNSPNSFLENPDQEIAPSLRKKLEELMAISVIEIMIPRPLIMALDADVQLRRVRRLKSTKASHFPVFKGDLDKILGWIEKSKVIDLLNEAREDQNLESFVHPVPYIDESAKVPALADLFIKSQSPFVVVTNPHGSTVGIVTLAEFINRVFGLDLQSQPATTTTTESISLTRPNEI